MKDKILDWTIFFMLTISKVMSTKFGDFVISNRSAILADTLVFVFDHCNMEHNTVMVVDDDRRIVKSLMTTHTLTSIIISDNIKITKNPDQLTKKVDVLIINIESYNIFIDNIRKNAPWLNVDTPCFILDTNIIYDSNSNPITDLLKFEGHNLLTVYYLTFGIRRFITVMGLFSSKVSYGRRITKDNICDKLYNEEYHSESDITMTSWIISNFGKSEKTSRPYQLHATALELEFNRRVLILEYPMRATHQLETHKNDWLLAYEDIDLFVWDFRTFDNIYYQITIPIHFYKWNLLVHHRGYKTTWEKIRDYYGVWIFVSLILILCAIFIVLKFTNKEKDLAFTLFEIIRFLINTGIVTPLNTFSLRIFMSVIFLYFLILHATFSGHLIEFLTKLEPLKNPQTLEDLKDPHYKHIFHPRFLFEYIKDAGLGDKALPYDDISKCMSQIVLSKSVVCIGDDWDLLHQFASIDYKIGSSLYKPQKGFGFFYTPMLTRKDKNMSSRVDKAFLRVLESGLDNFIQSKDKIKIINSQKRKSARDHQDLVSINFEILKPGFIILGIGLVCAMISFIFEVMK